MIGTDLRHFAAVLRGRVPLPCPLICEHCGRVRRSLNRSGADFYRRYGFGRCSWDWHPMRPVPHPSDTPLSTSHGDQS